MAEDEQARAVAELVLYVTEGTPAAARARANLERVLRSFASEAVRLEVCDVWKDALRAEADHVLFAPTLVLRGPPSAWLVGDLADESSIINLLAMAGVMRAT